MANFSSFLKGAINYCNNVTERANRQAEEIQRKNERAINNYEKRLSNCSNEELKERFYSSSSNAEKVAINNIVKERKGNK